MQKVYKSTAFNDRTFKIVTYVAGKERNVNPVSIGGDGVTFLTIERKHTG